MAIHQISVFLENRAGQLAEITALLAKNGVDLRAINIAETSDYGVLRLIASHEPEACRVLRENGFIFSTSDVVAVGVPDAPGGLSTLLQLLAENSIDVHYMYSIFGQPNGMACMILRVADPAAVSSLLAANGSKLKFGLRSGGSGLGCQRHPSRRCGNARHHLRRVTRKGRQTPCRK